MSSDSVAAKFHLPRLNEAESSAEFEKLFLDEICSFHYSLPLERLCTEGHGGDDIENEVVEVTDFSSNSVSGSYSFTFTESIYTGCRDISFSEQNDGSFHFFFDRIAGDLFLSGGTSERLYDPEEF